MPDLAPIVGVVLCALLIPIAIMIGRNNIREYRQRLLEDLERAYSSTQAENPPISLVPSFEMARYKYDMPPSETMKTLADAEAMRQKEASFAERRGKYYEFRIYSVPLLIYITLSAVGFYTFFILAEKLEPWSERSFLLLGMQEWPVRAPMDALVLNVERVAAIEYQAQTATAISFAFIGAYIWSVIYLVRRIANYDLNPLSFLRASVQILLACFTAAVLRHVVHAGASVVAAADVAGTLFAGLAFLIGFFPTLGIAYLVDRIPSARLKRDDKDAYLISRNLPLDTIDGMDTFIKFRFAEMEIEDVQNLATSNPILLFVESPYGLFEIIDWVAQAQLVIALGPTKVASLRRLGIRSIFDLETAAADPGFRSILASALIADATPPRDDAALVLVGTIGANLHVQRVRQV